MTKPSSHPLRYIVRHFHAPETGAPGEWVEVSYNTVLDEAYEYALNTARRYNGVIYSDYGEGDYDFVRSFQGKRQSETAPEAVNASA